jgi:hypothetical protein
VVDACAAAINAGEVKTAVSLVADDTVYDRPPPIGQLIGKGPSRVFGGFGLDLEFFEFPS